MAIGGFSHNRQRLSALLVLCVMGLFACVTPAPYQEMSDARQAVSAARDADAEKLSPKLYSESMDHLADAKRLMSERHFGLARYHANQARQKAAAALKKIQANQNVP